MNARFTLPRTPWRFILLLTIIGSTVGCVAEKESLHELDHVIPKHWPNGMLQCADFIEVRVSQLTTTESLDANQQTELLDELQDLIEWVPEISADTDLKEEDWVPINNLSIAIRGHLHAGDTDIELFEEDFSKLVVMLRDADSKLPVDEESDDDVPATPKAAGTDEPDISSPPQPADAESDPANDSQ